MADNTTPHLSDVYDSQILNTIPYYESFHNETINLVKAYKGEPQVWLDTGAGTGTLVSRCFNLFDKTLFILADPSTKMLDIARKKLEVFNSERYKIIEPTASQDIVMEGFKPDVITAIQVHHYLSEGERKKATQRCYDLMGKGGLYITFENIRPFTDDGTDIGKKIWSSFQLSRGKAENDVKKHMERFGTEYFPITVEQHLELYWECGFETVEILWYSNMQAGFYCIK